MRLSAKLMWGMGLLVPTFVAAAFMAHLNDLVAVTVALATVAALSVWGNRRMLRDIEEVMSRRLAVKSSEKQGLASSAADLLAFLVPVGDLFGDGFGWAAMFVVLVVGLGILQYVKPTPPWLLMFIFGYRPHKVTIEAGEVGLWLTGKDQLSPGDAVIAAEPTQKLWIGRITDV